MKRMHLHVFGVDFPWMGILPILSFLLWVGAGSGCSRSHHGGTKGKASSGGHAGDRRRPWPVSKQAWKSEQTSMVLPLERVGKVVVAVAYSRSRIPRRLLGIDVATGKVLWETKTLLAPELVRRASPWGMCWASAQLGEKSVFAYQRSRNRVTALDAVTGERLWTVTSSHGVTLVDAGMAVSDGKTLQLLDPLSGAQRLSLDLSLPGLGGGSQGVASGLKKKSCIQGLGKLVLVTRRDGGELQAIDPQAGKLVWRFSEPESLGRHVLRLPVADKTLLVPVGYPDPARMTVIMAWDEPLSDGKPAWFHTLGGKTFRKWIWVTDSSVLALYEDGAKRRFLVRLERSTGKRVYRVQIPLVRSCRFAEGLLACESAGKVVVYRANNGKEAWQASVGTRRDRLRAIFWAGSRLIAVTAGKILALEGQTGKALWSRPKKLVVESTGAVPISVLGVLGSVGPDTLAVVRTKQEEEGLDRVYLVSLRDDKIAWKRRLGKVPPSKRPNRINANDVDLKVPVVLSRAGDRSVVFSAVGGNALLLDAATGKVLRGFSLPGRKDRPTVMYDIEDSIALLERGGLDMAVDVRDAKILWRRARSDAEVTHFGSGEAFFAKVDGEVSWIGGPGKTKLPAALAKVLVARQAKVAFASGSVVFARTPKNVLVLRRDGSLLRKLRRTGTFFAQDKLVIGLQRRVKSAEVIGAYIGLDQSTGKVRWKAKVAVHSDEPQPPAPVLIERRWPVAWVRSAGKLFVTTDAVGRCVVALDAAAGKRKWSLCFDRIEGPPAYAFGYLFVAARGQAHAPQQAASGVRRAGASSGQTASLFAIETATGKAKRLFEAGDERKVLLGALQPASDGLFLVTDAPARKRVRSSVLVGLQLWSGR